MTDFRSFFEKFMSPGSMSAADNEAMMPETFANPMVKQMLGDMATLPKRAIESAGAYQPGSGEYDPRVPMEVAMSMTGGSGLVPANASLRAGLTPLQQAMIDGARTMRSRTPAQQAEELWQRNGGKLKSSLSELGRMRGPNMRDPDAVPDFALIDSLETMIREKATKPFVSQAKRDRISMAAEDIRDNTGALSFDALKARFPNEKDEILNDILSQFNPK